MVKSKCDKCEGWGIIKDTSDIYKCMNCYDKICYICENSRHSIFTECNSCDGKGEISKVNLYEVIKVEENLMKRS